MTSDNEDPRITRTRQAVIGAVTDLLAEGGWEQVTHQHVAERSGYARSTLYRHWPERIDFLRDVSDRAEGMAHAERITGDLRTDLLADLLAYRDVLFDLGGGTTLSALIGIAEHSDAARTIRDTAVRRGEAPVRQLLETAIDDGRLMADLDPVAGASELFGPVTHRRLMTHDRPDDDELAELVDAFLSRRERKGIRHR